MSDPFLVELREECLNDPDGRLGFLREAAIEIVDKPNASLTKMIKICTDIEANFRSVEFTFCAGLFAECIQQLREIGDAYTALGEKASPDDVFVLQFFLTDVVQTFENYFESLKTDGEDSESRANEYRPAVKILSSWRPSAVAVVEMAPAATLAAAPAADIVAAPVPEIKVSPVAVHEPIVNLSAIAQALAPSSAVDQRHQYLICRGPGKSESVATAKLQARVFAIPVQQVIEVIDRQPVNALPFNRPGLEGILNFRGDPLPVLMCFDRNDDGAKVDASNGKSFVIIANVDNRKFGFQMETVLSVTDLDPSKFENPEAWLSPQGGTWVTHFVKEGDNVILVMDLHKAIAA